MTHPPRFSADLLAQILFSELGIAPDASLLVAYSGGGDSQVLLHALSGLRSRYPVEITACHADHGLHPDSADWSKRCARWCRELGVAFRSERVALELGSGEGPEAAARHARYGWLGSLLAPGQALLTAHHADDQAETLLLQLLRGAGVQGLSAMPFRRPMGEGELVRPLLGSSRSSLRDYAIHNRLEWIEDPSNEVVLLDRNYLRHAVLAPLRERWPDAAAAFGNSARHAREAGELLDELAEIDLGRSLAPERSIFSLAPSLNLGAVRELSKPRAANLLRYWIRSAAGRRPPPRARLEEALRQFAGEGSCSGGVIAWEELELRCCRDRLYLLRRLPAPPAAEVSCVPGGETLLEGPGLVLCWRPVVGRGIARRHLSRGGWKLVPRRGGERCRLPKRGGLRPVKKFYQERGVPPWERVLLPLLFRDGELAWVPAVGACVPFAAIAEEAGLEPFFRPLDEGPCPEAPPA